MQTVSKGESAIVSNSVSALRGVPCPDAGPGLAAPDAVVLVVHGAALLAVLDAEAGTGSPGGGDVLGGLLRHERRYWQQSLASRVPGGLDPDVIDRVVTAGCLVGAADQEAAIELLAVIPDLADGRLRGTVARWLHDLYPVPASAVGPEWIGSCSPTCSLSGWPSASWAGTARSSPACSPGSAGLVPAVP